MADVLEHILDVHRRAAAADRRPVDALLAEAASRPAPRGFRAALEAPGLSVVAEIKRRSPSRGELAPGLVPGVLAKAYAAGGAACLSVLTDAEFFGGSAADLAEARAACDLPVLRKDFTVCERDVCDARLFGADAVLLIVAGLDDRELAALHRLAEQLSLAVLVEVHDEWELDRALDAGATLVGVNQRDLRTFEIDRTLAERVRARVPDGVVTVAESGIRNGADAAGLAAAGYDAILVGESLVTAGDPGAALRSLVPSP